eukprot:2879274-Rhodomonas_salina.3
MITPVSRRIVDSRVRFHALQASATRCTHVSLATPEVIPECSERENGQCRVRTDRSIRCIAGRTCQMLSGLRVKEITPHLLVFQRGGKQADQREFRVGSLESKVEDRGSRVCKTKQNKNKVARRLERLRLTRRRVWRQARRGKSTSGSSPSPVRPTRSRQRFSITQE